MHSKRNVWWWLMSWNVLLLLSACVQDIEIKPKDGVGKVVVSCVLRNEKVQELKLTYSSSLKDDFEEEVTDAKATLYEGENKVGTFTKVAHSMWKLPYTPERGKNYRLVVEVPGQPTITATTTMPIPVIIRRGATHLDYRVKNFVQYNHSAPFWIFALQSSFEDIKYHFLPVRLEDDRKVTLSYNIATTHKNVDRFNENGVPDEHNVFNDGSIPFEYYIRSIPDATINSQNPYEFTVRDPQYQATFIVMRSASAEYDKYLKSIIEKMKFYQSDDDPARWFDESVVYSNIHNGIGIFGAYWQVSFFNHNHVFFETPSTERTQ